VGKPTIVCLCGSTRFYQAFAKAQLEETLAGRIVLTIGSVTCSDVNLIEKAEDKEKMREKIQNAKNLHFEKIMLCDEIFVLNVGGYIGESTCQEIAFARRLGRRIRYLEDE